ncbi:MAG: enoyl-CoA hydratase/isomerase family protein [Gammaproteobacteria bacterium]|nr:enoyl-CoA hydratase/isomerase family protein [Gammaproteobacteria bacterium]
MINPHILSTTINNTIKHIVINRTKAKNALTGAMYLELVQALTQADCDNNIRAIIISGDENVFCAGNDLKDFLRNPPQDINAPAFKFLITIHQLKKPLIAATAGPAIGIGTTMLLHCDYVVSSNNTLFKMPFTSLGLTPEGGSSLLLTQLMGHRKAAELILLAKSFDAQTALTLGIINQVCDEGEVIQQAISVAQAMASQPPKAIQASKAVIKAPFVEPIKQAILAEAEVFMTHLDSDEAREALSDFIEKRTPKVN